ncbi:MAG: hypothetical protein A2020_05085 [Lentisphaerae bacterium GWF2_45_14]|nr:MAG: hypothetical protein A2020_05085 [Lentisphaerae bacterium GWF2_45_14]
MGFILVVGVASSVFGSFYFRKKVDSDPNASAKSLGFIILAVVCGVSLLFGKDKTMAFASQVMFLAFAGMIYCARKQRAYANAQSAAIFFFSIVLLCGITILSITFLSNETEKLIANEMKFAKAASIILGRDLAKRYPGRKALIVVEKNYEKSNRQKEMIEGLKDGMGSKIEIGAMDYVKVPIPEGVKNPEEIEMMPMWEMMRAEHFDNLLKEHPECNLVISLIGLPYDVGEMSIWTMDENTRPKVALLFADVHALKRAIDADYLIALTYKPGVKFSEDPAPKDPQKAFDQRYIILTKDNVKSVEGNNMFME